MTCMVCAIGLIFSKEAVLSGYASSYSSGQNEAAGEEAMQEADEITLPENLIIIEEEAFRGCRMGRVIIPEGVEEIRDFAFADNENLYYVSVPDSVQRIAGNAFYNDPNLCIFCNAGSYAEAWAIDNGAAYTLNGGAGEQKVEYISTPADMEIRVGEELSVAVAVGPETAVNQSVLWRSSDTTVAVVSDDGLITAVGAGQAIITIEAADGGGVSVSFTVTVRSDVEVTYTANSRQLIGSADACVARTILVSGASINDVTQVGCYLYDESGQLLGYKREKPTPLNGVINAWYDVESELGVTLSPGVFYSYRFVAVIRGTDYFSDYGTFILKEYKPNEQKIQAVIDRAYAWVNYTWTAPVDIPVYNNVYNDTEYPAYYQTEYYFKAGTVMHGLPYTLSNSKYNLEKYAALSAAAKAAATTFKYSGVLMWGPKYAADCSELVSDCLYYGDPLIGTDGQTHFSSNKAYMYEVVSWDEIAPGDALGKTGHTLIVVGVSGDNITTVEQMGNGDDRGALHCTHTEPREAGGFYVCGTCEACAGNKRGATVLRTRTKAELSAYTVYRYLPLYQ